MSKPLNVADLFCGAGGSSTGAARALGDRLGRLTAVDHWDVAIETHSLNHPEAQHYCSDVYRLAPRDALLGGVS